MLLYRTVEGPVVEQDGAHHLLVGKDWDTLLNADDLPRQLAEATRSGRAVAAPATLQAPIGTQEVWAAGVTYWRSRDARMTEAQAVRRGQLLRSGL